MSEVFVQFPAFFAAWVFDMPAGAHCSKNMFRKWKSAGLIQDAEEGYAATTAGRAAALAYAEKQQAEWEKKIKTARGRRPKQGGFPMSDLLDRMKDESAEVITALERADQGSMILCHGVLCAVLGRQPPEADLKWVSRLPGAVTESIDGAITLIDRIRPGADIDLEIRELMTDGVVRRVTDATIYGRVHSDESDVRGYGSTPALALCIAALRAHGIQKETP